MKPRKSRIRLHQLNRLQAPIAFWRSHVCGLSSSTCRNRKLASRTHHKRPAKLPAIVLAAGACLVLLLLLRGNWLFSSSVLNPDEAELLADGKRATLNLVPYGTYTTATYFFLWPMFLGMLGDIGIPLSLVTAHILSGLFYVYLAVAGWYIVYRQHGWKWATAIVGPTAVYLLAGASSADYLSLGTELLPIAILLTAALVLFGPETDITARRLAIGSTVAGLALWAKPQLAPLSVALVISGVLVRHLETRGHATEVEHAGVQRSIIRRDLLVSAVSYLAPTVLFLALILVTGELHPFLKEGLSAVFGYISSSNSTPVTLGMRLQTVGASLVGLPFALIWAIGGLLAWTDSTKPSTERVFAWTAWILPLIASILTLFATYQFYQHYANIVYAGSMLSAVVGCRISRVRLGRPSRLNDRRGAEVIRVLTAASMVVILFLSANTVWENAVLLRGYAATVSLRYRLPTEKSFPYGDSKLPIWCPAGSNVLVWGWAAEMYSYYDWEPASRYTISTWQLNGGGNVAYYRATLVAELEAEPPRCLVEAIGPQFFDQIPTSETIAAVIPASQSLLTSCYVERSTLASGSTNEQDGGVVTVYVRRQSCGVH